MTFKYLLSKLIKKIHIPAIINSEIDKTSKVCSDSHLVNVNLKGFSYVGNHCTIINSEIGRFCSIADNCIIGGASHPVEWVSTSPVFHNGKNILRKNFSSNEYNFMKKTIIGHDVWLGSCCLIKSGVIIGTGAVIGMGSVVTKDIGEYEIWAGNPARLIRKRFDDETIANLLDSHWWDFDEMLLTQYAQYFNDVNRFLNSIKGN